MTRKVIFIILLFSFVTYSHAQLENETPFEYTKRIYIELAKIKLLRPDEYSTKVDIFRTNLEKYIEHKKRVCEGEFSTIILTGKVSNNDDNKTNKLNKEERKLCYRELKALQITFINNMFTARKKFLDHLHKSRVKELGLARDEAIKNINNSFSRKK